jgi:hypothetical protein
MTPYELALYVETVSEIKEAEIQEKIALVWMGEYYHRMKRLPKLQDELKKFSNGDKNMTDEQMLETVKALNAQFGGTFVKSSNENPI